MFHQPAVVDDLLNEGGEGFRLKGFSRRFVGDDARGEVAAHDIARTDIFHRVGAFENGKSDIDGVAVENSRKGIGDDQAHAARLDGDGRVLAGGAAAEVVLRHDDIALPYLFYEIGIDIFHAVSGKLAFGRGVQVSCGNDDVRIDVALIFEYVTFYVHDVFSLKHIRRCDFAGNRARRRNEGGGEIDFARDVSHSSHEVAVGRGNASLVFGENTHVPAETGTAGRGGNDGARVDKDIDQAFVDRLQVNVVGCGNDDATNALSHVSIFENGGCLPQIGNVTVGAGADDDLIDGDIPPFGRLFRVFGQVREGYGGLERGEIHFDLPFVFGVGIGGKDHGFALESARHVVHGDLVHGENAVLGARLDRHVADGESVVDGEVLYAVARKFHGFVERAVHADEPDHVQNDVLARNVFGGLIFEHDSDRGRNLEPTHLRHHARRHIGGAYARGEGAERAVGAGVAVRADHQIARADQTLFGQERVFDAHLTDVKEVFDVLSGGKFSRRLALLRRLDVLVGGKMIHDEGDFIAASHAGGARLVELFDRYGSGNIVGEYHVEARVDELPRFYAVEPRVESEDLLRHRHSHI